MTEPELRQLVVAEATRLGVRTRYIPDSREVTGERGWPDLELLGPGGFAYAELKSETGELSEDQRECIGMLEAADIRVFIWRPCDRLSGAITRGLRRVAGLPIYPDA
jgi:hypothetical protein